MRTQPNRTTSPRPSLRAVARTKTLAAGFVLGVQQPDAKAQLAALATVALETLIDPAVRDVRDHPWIAIDEPASRDLDQLSVADVLPDGATRLRVAIADVDAWVPQGSPLDRHAARNAASVFTGVVTYPMLPEPLTLGRASLLAGADRLALVVELIVAPDGTVRSVDADRALVRNRAQLDYDAAGRWLAGEATALPVAVETPAIGEQLRLQEAVALALRDWRLAAGALDLVRTAVQPIFDGDRIVDLVVVLPNRARTLIEELMVAANAAIAGVLRASALPWIARTQTPRDWEGVIDLAAASGSALPAEPDHRAFGALVHQLRATDPDGFATLQPALARRLGGSADLVLLPDEEPAPHYGLALDAYTRATAPLRRYRDLLTQRLLKAALAGQPAPYTVDELDDLVEHCGERERAAETVEREMGKIYGSVLLQERTHEVFDATVSAANAYGVWARLDQPPVEGRLVEAAASLERGDRIRVRVTRTNWERGFIDLMLVP